MRDLMLFIHFFGLVLGMGSGFASLFISIYNKNIPKEEGPKFMLKLRSLGYMGLTGTILLVISGGYLATPYWSVINTMPLFIAKLVLVVVLIVLVLLIDRQWRKAVRSGAGSDLKLIPILGKILFPIGILILLFAVLQFH